MMIGTCANLIVSLEPLRDTRKKRRLPFCVPYCRDWAPSFTLCATIIDLYSSELRTVVYWGICLNHYSGIVATVACGTNTLSYISGFEIYFRYFWAIHS